MESAEIEPVTRRRSAPPGNTLSPPSETPPTGPSEGSLASDIEALFDDGKTYLEAELAYQKSRAVFTGNRVKWALVYGAAAFGFLHLALIALVVGAVMALTPLIGPWFSMLAVTILLLAGAGLFIARLRGKLREVRNVFDETTP